MALCPCFILVVLVVDRGDKLTHMNVLNPICSWDASLWFLTT